MPDEIDEKIQKECPHENVVEGVDNDGQLIEPAYDVCVDCGKIFHDCSKVSSAFSSTVDMTLR
jgi:hypothetical protein